MSVACPTFLKDKHDSAKFKETHREDPSIDFEAEGGWIMSRARFTKRPARTFTLGFTDVTDTRKTSMVDLYNDTRGSADIITNWEHPVTREVIDVRFKKGSIPSYKYKGYGGTHRWDIGEIILEEV